MAVNLTNLADELRKLLGQAGGAINQSAQTVANYVNPSKGIQVQQPQKTLRPTPQPLNTQYRNLWTDLPQINPQKIINSIVPTYNKLGQAALDASPLGLGARAIRQSPIAKGPVGQAVGGIAQNLFETPANYVAGFANATAGALNRNPQQALGGLGQAGAAALNVLPFAKIKAAAPLAGQMVRNGVLPSLGKGVVEGAKFGGAYGFLSGLDENKNKSIKDQLLGAVGSAGLNALLGGAVGGGLGAATSAVGQWLSKKPSEITVYVGNIRKGASSEEKAILTAQYLRNKLGQFAPKQYQETPEMVRFIRDNKIQSLTPAEFRALDMKINAPNESQIGLSIKKLTPEEGRAVRAIEGKPVTNQTIPQGGITAEERAFAKYPKLARPADQLKSGGFITTDGKIVEVQGHPESLNSLGFKSTDPYSNFGALNKYLDKGGIRTVVSKESGDINLEIHKAPTPEQMGQIMNLPNDRRYFIDLYKDGKYVEIGSVKGATKDEVINGIKNTFPNVTNQTIPKEVVREATTTYRSPHQIIGNTKPASDLNIDEVVKKAREYNGYLTKYDQADLSKLKSIQGNPDMEVKIYRASPVNELNNGDWITTSKTYAQDIKKQNGGKVYEYTVKASDLKYPNDITELPSLARFSAFKYEPSSSKLNAANQTINDVGAKVAPEVKTPVVRISKTPSAQVKVLAGEKTLPQQTKSLSQEANLKQQAVPEARPLENIISQSDNAPVDVKNKVGLLDYLRTPDRVLNKIGLGNEAKLVRQKYDDYLKQLPQEINKVTEWSKQVPAESNQRIFKYLDGQAIELNSQEMKVAGEIKGYLKDWATKLKLPVDKQISSYITHIFEKDFIKKEFDEDIAKLIKDRVAGSVYDPFLEQRLGKLGYVEDTWRALDAYVKRATRKFNMDQALGQVKEASQKLESSQYNYVKSYIDRVNLRPTDWDNLIDNSLKQVVGYRFGARPVSSLTRTARQMVYRGTLGLNIGSAVKNLTQGANTYAKLGEKYTLVGYAKNIAKMAAGDDELTRVGVLRDDFIQDRTLNATKKFWEKLDKGLFFFFETAEKINRGAAYFGAKAKALDKGMNEQQAIDYAKNIVRDTQFTFGSIDTPPVLQSDIAKLLLQFQSFTLKQGEFLGEMVQKKEFAGLARYALASAAIGLSVGKLIGMEPKDFIPSLRIGLPPTLQAPIEIGKAVVGAPDKYGNVPDAEQRLRNVGNTLIPFIPGGVQIKKTVTGLGDVARGYAQSPKGLVKYPVAQNVQNTLQAGLLGPSNLPEARQYREANTTPLSENQSNLFKQDKSVYTKIMNSREQNRQVYKAKESIKKQQGGTQEIGDKIVFWDEKSGEVKTISKAQQAYDETNAQYDYIADQLKDNEDYKTWVDTSEKYVDYLKDYKKTLTAPDEKDDALRLQKKIETLEDSIAKYKEYGGFKKPKKAAKIKLSLPKQSLFKIAAPSRVKTLKIGSVKKAPKTQNRRFTIKA